jgi:drug/metabolite transporter (DMT)-like permease
MGFIFLCIVWGSTWMAIRIVVTQLPPLRMAAIRFAIAGTLVVPIVLARRAAWPRGRQLRAAIWIGVFMIGAQYGLIFWGETMVSSGLTAVIYSSSPLAVAALTPWVLKKRTPRSALFAMLCGVGGIAIVFGGAISTSLSQAVGVVMIAVGVFFSAGGVLFAKRELTGMSPFATTAVQFFAGSVVLGIASLIIERGQPNHWTHIAFWSLVFLILSSVVTFAVYFWLLFNVDAHRVTSVQLVIPLIAVAEGGIILHEYVSLTLTLGAILVLASLVVIMRAQPQDDDLLGINPVGEDVVFAPDHPDQRV